MHSLQLDKPLPKMKRRMEMNIELFYQLDLVWREKIGTI
jgi:hypothetical protein